MWDPTVLLELLDENRGYLPLHRAAYFCSIQGFKSVFETGIRYYPIKKGINILFKKDIDGDTPFQYACKRFGYEQVMNVIIEDALVRSSSSDNNTPSINIVEALVMAAIDESIHLDCVYFLLRRQPDLLVKLS